jgi:hypothetical protein
MANKVYQYYTELPSWAKGIVVVGGIAIIYITAKQLVSKIKEQSQFKKQRQGLDNQRTELKDMLVTGARLSYAQSQYKTWATQIASEFAGCDPLNSSYGKFANIMYKLKNNADYLALSTAFDIQEYDQCGIFNGNFKGNLQEAVNDEFDVNEVNRLNNELAKQGITYRF